MPNLSLKKISFFLLFTGINLSLFSQTVLDSAGLDSVKTYRSLESALKNPDEVYKLVLTKQKLKEFPAEITQFKNLNYLDLSQNKIKEVPDFIGDLTALQHFSINRNKVEKINKKICDLPNLKHLAMFRNDIDSIPDEIGQLTQLEVLDIWSNNIAYYPFTMKNLKSLKFMDISGILINDEIKEQLRVMLPKAKISWEESCGCDL